MKADKEHLLGYLRRGTRYDGRKLDEFRPVSVEIDVSATAEGSATVTIGDTMVMAGVKMGLEKPYPDTPDEGGLMVNTELLPMSNPEFEAGPPSIKSIEIARVVDRGIREAEAIDRKQLCITRGELAWFVGCDICTINDAGNLIDASGLATLAALRNARFPKREGGELDYKTKTDEKVPMTKDPVSVTVYKIGEFFLVDPLPEEEHCTDARLTVSSTDGVICAMQKGGEMPLTVKEVEEMVDLAIKKAEELRKAVKL